MEATMEQTRKMLKSLTINKTTLRARENCSTGPDELNPQVIPIDPDTHRPTIAWEKLKVKQTVTKLTPNHGNEPRKPGHVRFVCVSDTHSMTNRMTYAIPDGDVLLHAGDFSNTGLPSEIVKFNEFLGTLPHKHKIVIAGNHELSFEDKYFKDARSRQNLMMYFGVNPEIVEDFLKEFGYSKMKDVLTNCTYLEDSSTTLYGLKIYGSPWQPEFGCWGFNLRRGLSCLEKWNLIPDDTDILLTHGPPIGHGDMCCSQERTGCVELLTTIQKRVRPKYHVFGHIHEDYGVTTDGHTVYINASICTLRYRPTNHPVVFDMPLPEGYTIDSPIASA